MTRRGISIRKSRAVVHICGRIGAPRQADISSQVQRIPLVMIQVSAALSKAKIRQASGDVSTAEGNLIGVGDVDLSTLVQSRRVQGEFPSLNDRTLDGDRKENIRIVEAIVVEEIFHMISKGIGVYRPTPQGDCHADLRFLVAFSMQRNESQILVVREI